MLLGPRHWESPREEGQLAQLCLSLLGSFRLTLDGQPFTTFKSNKARALLAYLAVEADRPHSREKLAGLLWPDWPDRSALSNLRYTLSSLRRAICKPEAQSSVLLISRENLQFDSSADQWVDVRAFSDAVATEGTGSSAVSKLEEAVALYQGSFLEGFSLEDSQPFEEWTILTRQKLARDMLTALRFLATHYEECARYDLAEQHARRQLELEPWDEVAHRQLIRILSLSGQRSAAINQYEICRRALADELGVDPSPETTELLDRVRDGRLNAPEAAAVHAPASPAELPDFLREVPLTAEPPVFVGRERELQRLAPFLDAATSGEGRIAFVTGEAGSGKTALLQAFARQAEEAHPDLVAVAGNCSAYTGIGDPYLPFREILELLTGDIEGRVGAGAITGETARRLWQMMPAAVESLAQHGPDLVDTFLSHSALPARAKAYAPAGAEWLQNVGAAKRRPYGSFGLVDPQQNDLFEQFTRVLQAMARDRTLLVMIDDLQWGDPGSISLLFHLGRHLAGSRVLVIGAYRPEEVALEKAGQRHPLVPVVNEFCQAFGDIILNVDQAEGRRFIDEYLATEPNRLGPSFREMLWRQTRGHPLFTIELLRGLQERGDLVHDKDGNWVEGPTLNWEMLPVRIEAAIRERISRMPEGLRHALAVASVEGEEFTAEVVAQVCTMDSHDVLERLSSDLDRKHRLVRAHSIQRIDGKALSRFKFRHILFQKFLYGAMDEVERAHLHEEIGTALEMMYGTPEQRDKIAVQLALHFQKAGVTKKAIHYLHQAGEQAVLLCAYSEGLVHLDAALALLETQPDSAERASRELALHLSLGKACMADRLGERWQVILAKARELCQRTGQAAELSQVLGEQATYHYVRAEYRSALELGEEALNLAEHAGDPVLVALGHWRMGFIRFAMGALVESRAHLREVLDFYKPQSAHPSFVRVHGVDAGVSAMAYDACCLWLLGYPEKAQEIRERSMVLAGAFEHAFSLADVMCYGGCFLDRLCGDAASLKVHAEELIALSEGLISSFSGAGNCYRGDALAQMGQVNAGIAQMRSGLATRRAKGSWCSASGMLGALAQAIGAGGQLEEALAVTQEAFDFVEASGERNWEPELHRLRAELLAAQGNVGGAEQSLHRALEVARELGTVSWELRAALDLARLWNTKGKAEEARALIAPIYERFTEGFDTPDLREAKTLLGELET
jgi:DNA-binding SARP family transcriptional activator